MLELNSIGGISLKEVVNSIPAAERKKYLDMCDLKKMAVIFEDGDMMATCNCLFENSLNVSKTAQKLYMHRNTLIYRLKKLKKITGLDVRGFNAAVTFNIVHLLYCSK